MDFNSIGGRKFFVVVMFGGITPVLLRAFDKLDDATFGLVTVATVAAYIAGNVTQKVKGQG